MKSTSTAFVASSIVRCPTFTTSFSTTPRRLRHFRHVIDVNANKREFARRRVSLVPYATAVSNTAPQSAKPIDPSDSDSSLDSNNPNSSLTTPTLSATPTGQKGQAPLLRFGRSLLKQWKLLVPAIIAALIASVCAVMEPPLFGRILSIISSIHHANLASESVKVISQHKKSLYLQIFVIAVTYVIEMIATVLFMSFAARAADRTIRNLREKLFKATLSNDVAYFDRVGRDQVERAASLQLRIARQSFWDNLNEDRGLRAILETIFGVIICIKLTGPIGIPIFCFIIPIVSLSVARLGLNAGRLNAKVEAKEADFLSFMSERMRGLNTLKAFGAEKKEFKDLSSLLNIAQKTIISFIDTKSSTACANRLNIYVSALFFFFFGGHLVLSGAMTFESFSSLIGFIWVLNYSIHGLLFTFTDTAKASVALSNVYSMLDDAVDQKKLQECHYCPPAELPPVFQGHVQFKNVTFSYPSRPGAPVLNNLSFDMTPGQMIALVGESGGGKSTVAGLLCRFYRPSEGSILIDGLDVQCIPSDYYARQISVVDQQPFLFEGSIRDNIAYGLPDDVVDDEQIIRAAKEANAHDFITELAEGYDTIWSPGSNLSGGQRQRIAIARSLVKSPRLLVLDEATSALDQESESAVQAALEKIMKTRTTLIIAHRLSTIRSADVILFIKGGQIIEEGTFNQLYAIPNGSFKSLVDSSSTSVKNTGTILDAPSVDEPTDVIVGA